MQGRTQNFLIFEIRKTNKGKQTAEMQRKFDTINI